MKMARARNVFNVRCCSSVAALRFIFCNVIEPSSSIQQKSVSGQYCLKKKLELQYEIAKRGVYLQNLPAFVFVFQPVRRASYGSLLQVRVHVTCNLKSIRPYLCCMNKQRKHADLLVDNVTDMDTEANVEMEWKRHEITR